MGENICKLNIQNGVNIQNVQRTHTTQPTKKKPTQLDLKMGRRCSYAFFQRRHTDDQQVREKMFNINNHQGMQIKTTMKHHLTPVRKQARVLSRVQHFVTPWTVAHQGPLSTGLSRQGN